jgi:hypothetical protein
MLFPTTRVASYPQPEWLMDREKLAKRFSGDRVIFQRREASSSDCTIRGWIESAC